MARTIPLTTTRRGLRVWHVQTDEGVYRISAYGDTWNLKRRSLYGGSFAPVDGLDVTTFLRVHWLTLADA